jgi:hypothetical protein
MPILKFALRKSRETLEIYWVLARIVVPVTIVTELLSRMGVIEAVAPAFAPVMGIVGLPPELGLAWLSGLLVGIWGAVPLVFALVPVSSLSVADITVFSALLLFAHGLPIEQKIIQQAGPGMIVTSLLRVVGGLLYAFLLHKLLAATGWLGGAGGLMCGSGLCAEGQPDGDLTPSLADKEPEQSVYADCSQHRHQNSESRKDEHQQARCRGHRQHSLVDRLHLSKRKRRI